jgi:tetratricopeptide (TPR) repeat protein
MNAKHLLDRGDVSRKAKNFAAAIPSYLEALAQDPHCPRALLGLADAYRGVNDVHQAVGVLNHYLGLKPADAAAHSRLGDAYRRTGQRDLAVQQYREALALDGTNRYALAGLGELYHKEQRFPEALTCWETLLELDPDQPRILTLAGNLQRRLHAFPRAAWCFRRALALGPRDPYLVFGLADCLRGQGLFAEACPLWDELLEADPCNRQVLTRAGDCFLALGAADKAEGLFRRALGLGHERSAVLGLARIQRQRGDFAGAMDGYAALLARRPEEPRTILLMCETLAEWQGLEAALAFLQEQCAAHPGLRTLDGALKVPMDPTAMAPV